MNIKKQPKPPKNVFFKNFYSYENNYPIFYDVEMGLLQLKEQSNLVWLAVTHTKVVVQNTLFSVKFTQNIYIILIQISY